MANTFVWLLANKKFKGTDGWKSKITGETKKLDERQLDKLEIASMEEDYIGVHDEIMEVDLGKELSPWNTFIGKALHDEKRVQLITLLQEFKDYFAWDYTKMLGLGKAIVEHNLPIKESFKLYIQPRRRILVEVILKVKIEIERLFKVEFTRIGRDLNRVAPKDEYPMPIANILINTTSGHKLLSL